MKEISEYVIPIGFYNPKKWCDNIVKHYANDDFPEESLQYPIEALTASFANIINVYGNYPKDVKIFLSQATNPLFAPEEYVTQIYSVIKEKATQKKDAYIDAVAESLYYIRLLFEQDKEYVCDHFTQEINIINNCEGDECIEKFTAMLSNITKVHANQVSKLISKYCKDELLQ